MLKFKQKRYFGGPNIYAPKAGIFFEIELEGSSIVWRDCDLDFTTKAQRLVQNSVAIFSELQLFQETATHEGTLASPEIIFHNLNYLLTKDFQVAPTMGVTICNTDNNSYLVFTPSDDEVPALAAALFSAELLNAALF